MLLGEAEAEVRKAFRVARQASPCILFFDEIDALVTNRFVAEVLLIVRQLTEFISVRSAGGGGSGGGSTSPEGRVLATLLTEMDGITGCNNNVFVFAATNRLDCIDAALLRKVLGITYVN